MRNRERRKRWGVGFAARLGAVILLGLPCATMGQATSKTAKVGPVSATAAASQEAVVAGESFDVAVVLKMDKGWYVYWANPGGSGLPTKTTWTVPAGYSAGRTLYPVPQVKFDKLLKETSFIHEGEAAFVTRIEVPSSAAAERTATFQVDVSWLVCMKNCIPGSTTLSLSLPVVAKGTLPKVANKELFEAARDALPTPGEKAEHIKLSGKTDKTSVKPGDKFTAMLAVEIAAKHHMQSHKPMQDYLVPAVLFVEAEDGLEIGEVSYPKAHLRDDKVLGEKLSEYSGRIAFDIPVAVDADADATARSIRGVLQYQICTDTGTCYPPQAVSFEVSAPMGGGAKAASGSSDAEVIDTDVDIERPAAAAAEPGAESGFEESDTSVGSGKAAVAAPGTLERIQSWFEARGYSGILMMAFLGGIVLNLMPCVLPVISLKILSFVKQADEDRGRILLLGTAYCLGIIVFFTLIAVLFWQTDKQFGWGQQFQRPRVILGLAAVVTAFAMSLFGVLALFAPRVVTQLGEKAEGEGIGSAFFTGVLATVLGTACTAPLLSAAVGAASKYSPFEGAMIFEAVGVGMAMPFLILAANPGWLKYVPRPGAWMETFEAIMGFLLLGTVVWLLYPLLGQIGAYGMLLTMIFLLMVALTAWVKGKIQFGDPLGRKVSLGLLSAAILAIGWVVPFRWISTIDDLVAGQIERTELLAIGEKYKDHDCGAAKPDVFPWNGVTADSEFPWIHYDRSDVHDLVDRGYTVFVDYTANWCVNCKVNLKSSIDVESVRARMAKNNVIPFEADYTLPVPAIKEDLKRFGRAGVPMYLVYSPNDRERPQVLPEILTPQIVLDALEAAGPSKTLGR